MPLHSTQVRMTHSLLLYKNRIVFFSTSDKPVISVSIAGVSRDVLINSGSFNNLIRQDTVQELKDQGLKIGLQPCTKKRQRA